MSNELSTVLKNVDLTVYKEGLEENKDLSGGMFDSFPCIKTVGKEFVLTVGGEPVGKPSKELIAVIIKANKNKSNKLYKTAFNPKEPKGPDCSSADDIRPDSIIENPESEMCANCPHHAFGGDCRPHRRIVLCFIDQKNNSYNLYRLDIPAATLKSLKVYGDLLNQHKVPVSVVLTKITMDNDVTYAKFNFDYAGMLPVDIYKGLIAKAKNDPLIQTMLESTVTVDLVKEDAVEEKEESIKKTTKKATLANVDFEKELDAAIAENLD